MRKTASLSAEFALPHRVVHAGLVPQVVAETASVSHRTVVIVVELTADVFGWLGLDDLSLDGVAEVAVEAVLAVTHVEVDAGVEIAVDMLLPAVAVGALVHCKILVWTVVFDLFQLTLEALILQELLVIHCC